MDEKFYQLKITLKGSKPSIWRRIIIEADTPLEDLHYIIQDVMGWYNAHLHLFKKGTLLFEPEEFSEGFFESNGDYDGTIISDLLKKEKDKIEYEYDFGDGWAHTITLEKILNQTKYESLPVCTGGKNACPPEDCGGIPGYYMMLEALKDPKHPEYESYKEWLGGDFDPTYFNIDDFNELM